MKRRGAAEADPRRPGLVLDTGALLAIEAGELTDVLSQANVVGLPIRLSGGALAQAWRGGPRCARIASLLRKGVIVVPLDSVEARRVGEFVARTRSKRTSKVDVIDAHAAFLTRETRSLVYTSDGSDLASYGVPEAWIRRV